MCEETPRGGLVNRDWPYSTFRKYRACGLYDCDWGSIGDLGLPLGVRREQAKLVGGAHPTWLSSLRWRLDDFETNIDHFKAFNNCTHRIIAIFRKFHVAKLHNHSANRL
jgi:hypothetical protein